MTTIKTKDILSPRTSWLHDAMLSMIADLGSEKFPIIPGTEQFELEFKINGVEADPYAFFSKLEKAYQENLNKTAREMIDGKLHDRIYAITDLLQQVETEIGFAVRKAFPLEEDYE